MEADETDHSKVKDTVGKEPDVTAELCSQLGSLKISSDESNSTAGSGAPDGASPLTSETEESFSAENHSDTTDISGKKNVSYNPDTEEQKCKTEEKELSTEINSSRNDRRSSESETAPNDQSEIDSSANKGSSSECKETSLSSDRQGGSCASNDNQLKTQDNNNSCALADTCTVDQSTPGDAAEVAPSKSTVASDPNTDDVKYANGDSTVTYSDRQGGSCASNDNQLKIQDNNNSCALADTCTVDQSTPGDAAEVAPSKSTVASDPNTDDVKYANGDSTVTYKQKQDTTESKETKTDPEGSDLGTSINTSDQLETGSQRETDRSDSPTTTSAAHETRGDKDDTCEGADINSPADSYSASADGLDSDMKNLNSSDGNQNPDTDHGSMGSLNCTSSVSESKPGAENDRKEAQPEVGNICGHAMSQTKVTQVEAQSEVGNISGLAMSQTKVTQVSKTPEGSQAEGCGSTEKERDLASTQSGIRGVWSNTGHEAMQGSSPKHGRPVSGEGKDQHQLPIEGSSSQSRQEQLTVHQTCQYAASPLKTRTSETTGHSRNAHEGPTCEKSHGSAGHTTLYNAKSHQSMMLSVGDNVHCSSAGLAYASDQQRTQKIAKMGTQVLPNKCPVPPSRNGRAKQREQTYHTSASQTAGKSGQHLSNQALIHNSCDNSYNQGRGGKQQKLEIKFSKLIRKMLKKNKHVQEEFAFALSKRGVITDANDMSNGRITVVHPDQDSQQKVEDLLSKYFVTEHIGKDVISEVGDDIRRLCDQNSDLFLCDFSKEEGCTILYHTDILENIKSLLFKLKYKTMNMHLPGYMWSHLHIVVKDLEKELKNDLQFQVEFEIKNNPDGAPYVSVTTERAAAAKTEDKMFNLLGKLLFREAQVDPSVDYFWRTEMGQFIKDLERKHQCTINVQTPNQQLLLHAWSPQGHQLMVYEGDMVDADAKVVVLPLSERQKAWPSTHKHILDSGKVCCLKYTVLHFPWSHGSYNII